MCKFRLFHFKSALFLSVFFLRSHGFQLFNDSMIFHSHKNLIFYRIQIFVSLLLFRFAHFVRYFTSKDYHTLFVFCCCVVFLTRFCCTKLFAYLNYSRSRNFRVKIATTPLPPATAVAAAKKRMKVAQWILCTSFVVIRTIATDK